MITIHAQHQGVARLPGRTSPQTTRRVSPKKILGKRSARDVFGDQVCEVDRTRTLCPRRKGVRAWSQASVRALLMREAAPRFGLAFPRPLAGARRSVAPLLRRLVDLFGSEENDRLAIDRSGRGDRQVQ